MHRLLIRLIDLSHLIKPMNFSRYTVLPGLRLISGLSIVMLFFLGVSVFILLHGQVERIELENAIRLQTDELLGDKDA